jgi:hypothetical protein
MTSYLNQIGAGIATVIACTAGFLTPISANAGVDTHVERLCLGTALDEDCFVAPPPTNGRADPSTATRAPFCEAALAAERAGATEADPAVIQTAFDTVSAAAPSDIKGAVDTVIETFLAGAEGSPEFDAAYGELLKYVKDTCGFAELTVTATEYAFGGLPATLEAGAVVIDFENTGEEFHQLLVLRVNDGVTETLDELLALPEAEGQSKAAPVGGAFAAPGGTGHGMIDFEPGRYIAICFLPTGATPENMPLIEAGEHDGAPHFTQGMVVEFNVT